MQTATTHDHAATSAEPAPPLQSPEPATTSGGFGLDEFLDGTCEQEPGKQPGVFQVVVADLGAHFKTAIAAAIDVAAPPGVESELALAAKVRCPIQPPLFATGALQIQVARTTSAVTLKLGGGLGLSVGDGVGAFADLMANTAIEAVGTDSTRAVEMLLLAIEVYVRSMSDSMLITLATPPPFNVVLGPLVALANATGYGVSDLLADTIWGIGHAGAVKAAMKDGESVEISAGVSLGGSVKAPGVGGPDVGAELTGAVTGTTRIAKTAGKDTTTSTRAELGIAFEMEIGPVTGGIDIEVPLEPRGAGKASFSGSFKGDPKVLGGLQKFIAFFDGAIAATQQAFAEPPPDAADAAHAASSSLSTARQALGPALVAVQDTIVQAIASRGVPGVGVGVEATLELDLAAKTATVHFATITEIEANVPGVGKGGVERKLPIGHPIVFAIA